LTVSLFLAIRFAVSFVVQIFASQFSILTDCVVLDILAHSVSADRAVFVFDYSVPLVLIYLSNIMVLLHYTHLMASFPGQP